jgi:hypothetical protein
MGAPTNYYVDPAAGNDWPGSTFTDGAFTNADKTLTKDGAFTAANAKVGARLYLADNGSGRVTPGYYVIASRISDNAVVLNADIRSGANDPTDVKCVQATGTTTGSPWASTQFALNKITRDSTNGDRINLKAGTDDVLTAALSRTAYGTPANTSPLLFEGYTSSQGDGGFGQISGGGAVSILNTGAGWRQTYWKNLKLHNCGAADIFQDQDYIFIERCHFENTTGDGIQCANSVGTIIGCYFANIGGYGVRIVGGHLVYGNWFELTGATDGHAIGNGGSGSVSSLIANNVIRVQGAKYGIYVGASTQGIVNNSIWSNAGTGFGIYAVNANELIANNLIEGFSGVGGYAINLGNAYDGGNLLKNNYYYNCANASNLDQTWGGLTLLGASPFTDAANKDMTPVPAVRGLAYPTSWPVVSQTSAFDLGAVQHSDSAGGETSHVFIG